MNQGESAILVLDAKPVEELSVKDYNVGVINSICSKYKGFRQESKSP